MTSARDIIAARREQTRQHNAIVRRHLPTLLRIDTSNADPIVAHYTPRGVHLHDGRVIVGYYKRLGYGDDEPWNPVFAGDIAGTSAEGSVYRASRLG